MKKLSFLPVIMMAIFLFNSSCAKAQTRENESNTRIQVALLLDTSSSMDGLIEQAKSRLWDIVNTLTTLKYQGKTPVIEISLYEYGNDWLSSRSGYIRQITPMSNDLDLLSEKLFALKTNGGSEYCGQVINQAVKDIEWGKKGSDMKLIYIAGNESFDQGRVSYKEAISSALAKDIYINTIYCGDHQYGIRELWKDGADRGKGKYFNIDYNAKVRHIATPYDDRISECNTRLNSTYIAYGAQGREKQRNQIAQDENARKVSKENYASRAISKSKAVYENSSWDLVDSYSKDKNVVSTLRKEELPKELQNKSKQEIETVIVQKQKERNDIQKEIADLAKKRQDYIDVEMKKENNDSDDLGKAINESILALSKTKGYTIEK